MLGPIKCTAMVTRIAMNLGFPKIANLAYIEGSEPIKCTAMVTRIAMNLGCPKMANLSYIEGDVHVLGPDHFGHAHILHEEPDHSLSMLYGCMAIRLPNLATLVKVLHYSLIG
jgi:hypothetical protein